MRRSAYDREILRLALPALGALAAEPLYLLVDTAIVGHLGTPQLAALALAATILSVARRALHLPHLRDDRAGGAAARRRRGPGGRTRSPRRRCGSRWAIGVTVRPSSCVALADPLIALLGGDGRRRGDSRRATCGSRRSALPFALIALAGQGWLRGVGDLRTPLVIVVVANVVNVVLEVAVRLRPRLGPRRLGAAGP